MQIPTMTSATSFADQKQALQQRAKQSEKFNFINNNADTVKFAGGHGDNPFKFSTWV